MLQIQTDTERGGRGVGGREREREREVLLTIKKRASERASENGSCMLRKPFPHPPTHDDAFCSIECARFRTLPTLAPFSLDSPSTAQLFAQP
jgi:hypothetical protein